MQLGDFMTSHLPTATTATPPVIELRAVSRSFGSQEILRNLSLSVRPGETLVIIGESGCGKSVTLKLIMGLLPPTTGEVLWNGRPVQDRSEAELNRDRLKIGFLRE